LARIGYWITSREWEKGFGSKALELAFEIAKQIGIREGSAKIDSRNQASIAMWAKHGADKEVVGNKKVQVRIRL